LFVFGFHSHPNSFFFSSIHVSSVALPDHFLNFRLLTLSTRSTSPLFPFCIGRACFPIFFVDLIDLAASLRRYFRYALFFQFRFAISERPIDARMRGRSAHRPTIRWICVPVFLTGRIFMFMPSLVQNLSRTRLTALRTRLCRPRLRSVDL